MTRDRFETVMRAVNDEYLEEAQAPQKAKQNPWKRYTSIAAVVAVCFLSTQIWFHSTERVDAAMLAELGYEMQVPASADDVEYDLVKLNGTQTAQATFEWNGAEYIYQEQKSEIPQLLGAGSGDVEQNLSLHVGPFSLEYAKTAGESTISWYTADNQTAWCLRTDEGDDNLLAAAREILLETGIDIAKAPNGAAQITYGMLHQDDLTIVETTFVYDGHAYAFRMAPTGIIAENFADISGLDGTFVIAADDEIQYCPAKLYYTPGAQGKVIWFDIVPGLLYSLTIDEVDSPANLLDMANMLFAPAQGDAG